MVRCLPLIILISVARADEPFAVEVVDYTPAPGAFVCQSAFNDPARALGPPVGGGTVNADLSSLVTLGGFGGSLTLRFDHPVEDDPLNPFGVDAIVFSNALWQGGDPQRHVSEAATIEIALDADGDGLISDTEGWFLIAGSHLDPPEWYTLDWDADPCTPVRTTGAFMLPEDVFGGFLVVNPSRDPALEGIYGYAEYTPTLVLGDLNGDDIVEDTDYPVSLFYTTPDDPRSTGMTAGSGGGDAFDIAWAVDATGRPASLRAFDHIRLTTASHVEHPVLGEVSAEIDAVADVAPDPRGDCDADGDIDLVDHACVQVCAGASIHMAGCAELDEDLDGVIGRSDIIAWTRRLTGPEGHE